MKKEILCYGDSNTWGCIPRWKDSLLPSKRYDEETRWPCVMASELGSGYHVIEEGLGGRTTIYDDKEELYKRGIDYLLPCLLTHRPLDLVIIMLGTNDLQLRNQREPLTKERLGNGIEELVKVVKNTDKCGRGNRPPQILLLAPIPIKQAIGRIGVYANFGGEEGERLSRLFPEVYEQTAKKYECGFLNAACYAEPDDGDGVHFSRDSHPRLGRAVAAKVKEMMEE